MKRTKKILALVLTIAMCFTLVSTMAFAEGPQHLKYLAIGDSTSQGYFSPGYVDVGQAGNLQPVYNEDGSEYENASYVYMMYHYLQDYAAANGMAMGREDFCQYTLCGMRPNELLYILDPDNAPHDKFCDQRVGWYDTYDNMGGFGTHDLHALSDIFHGAIAEADVITYDLGMNCFGNYLIDRLMALLGSDYSKFENDTFEFMYNQIDNEATKAACKTLESSLKSMLGGVLKDDPEMADKLLDFALYCYASFCVYFDKTMDIIYNENPEAQVIVVSQYNGMKDLQFIVGEEGNEITIDFGKIMGMIFSAMNTHITGVSKHADWYKFADCGDVTTFTDEIKSGNMRDTTKEVFQIANDDFTPLFNALNSPALYENIAKIAQHPQVKLTPVIDALSGKSDPIAPVMKALQDAVGCNDDELSVAYILVICKAARGFASHPNIEGYQQKFEAVKKAFEGNETANANAMNVAAGIAKNAIGTVWSAIKAPVLEAIANVFDNIGSQFQAFLETVAQSIENIIMQFFPIKLK